MVEVTSENFKEQVEESEKLVLVDFWGPLCQPCLALMPVVEQLADRYKENLKVTKIDSSKNRRLCINLKIGGLPTFLLYRKGQEIGRLTGGQVNEQGLIKFISGQLNQ